MYRMSVVALLAVAFPTAPLVEGADANGARVVFSRDIQPLLAKHCLLCHGPDAEEAGLRLDVPERARAELDSGFTAIVPGKPQDSELVRRVTAADEFERMPPDEDPLNSDQIALLRQWIQEGAEYAQHWAYQPVKEPALPAVKNESWVRNPIDRFVLARLAQADLAPSPEADRTTKPPGTARLAGLALPARHELEPKNTRQDHRPQCRLPAVLPASPPTAGRGSDEPSVGPPEPTAGRGGNRPRPAPVRQRPAKHENRRAKRLPAAANRSRRIELRQQLQVGHQQRRRPLPPRHVYLLQTNVPLSQPGLLLDEFIVRD